MTDPEPDRLVGENRCWACTLSNGLVAALVGGVPLVGGVVHDDPVFLAATVVWAAAVFGYTLYRLMSKGYLPGSEAIAKRTGLHDRIGPGARDDEPRTGTVAGPLEATIEETTRSDESGDHPE